MPRSSRKVVVLGAGPTGLGAAWRLAELGETDVIVVERADRAGGLAATVTDGAFSWDLGVHVVFSHYPAFDAVLDAVVPEWVVRERRASAWLGAFVDYPVQLHLDQLPEPVRSRCLAGLRHRPVEEPTTFDDWILCAFGGGLADAFMRPYNRKLWGVDPCRMSHGWVGDRVAVPDPDAPARPWGPNATFRYPARGGTGAIWAAVAARLPIRWGTTVAAVDARRRVVTTSRGELPYDVLISTLPVDLLARCTVGAEALRPWVDRLACATTHVYGFGVAALPEPLRDRGWVYVADPDVPFHRLTVYSAIRPDAAPPGCHALLVESAGGDVEAALNRLGWLGPVVARFHRRLVRGYPVPTLDRDAVLAEVLPALEAMGIYSRGRFGAWKYEVSNQDHSFMQGVEVVDRLLLGVPERTLPDPRAVNGR